MGLRWCVGMVWLEGENGRVGEGKCEERVGIGEEVWKVMSV